MVLHGSTHIDRSSHLANVMACCGSAWFDVQLPLREGYLLLGQHFLDLRPIAAQEIEPMRTCLHQRSQDWQVNLPVAGGNAGISRPRATWTSVASC